MTGTDGVELYRRVVPGDSGYTLELVVHSGTRTTVATLRTDSGGCAAGTCVEDRPRSARLRVLDAPHGAHAFGLDITSDVTVTHTYKEAKPIPPMVAYAAVGCVVTPDGAECIQLGVGDRWPACVAKGWRGTRARFECDDGAHEVELAAPLQTSVASVTLPGLSDYDASRVAALMQELVNNTFDDRADCAKLTNEVTTLFDGNPAIVTLARTKAVEQSKPVQDQLWTIVRILNDENALCRADPAFHAAMSRLEPP